MSYTVKHLHIDQAAVELFLGPLEAKVMSVIWARYPKETTARQIQTQLMQQGFDRYISTVGRTLDRLLEKKLVIRRRNYDKLITGAKPWCYKPTYITPDEFIQTCVNTVVLRFRELGYIDDVSIRW